MERSTDFFRLMLRRKNSWTGAVYLALSRNWERGIIASELIAMPVVSGGG
jgi:hypothetical protein